MQEVEQTGIVRSQSVPPCGASNLAVKHRPQSADTSDMPMPRNDVFTQYEQLLLCRAIDKRVEWQ